MFRYIIKSPTKKHDETAYYAVIQILYISVHASLEALTVSPKKQFFMVLKTVFILN